MNVPVPLLDLRAQYASIRRTIGKYGPATGRAYPRRAPTLGEKAYVK